MNIISLPTADRRGADSFSIAVIEDPNSFEELITEFRGLAEGREGRCFITLDFVEQCLYTSTHARLSNGLDAELDYPDDPTPEALALFDMANFRHAQQLLADPAKAVEFSQLAGELNCTDTVVEELVALNEDPDLLLDDIHIVQQLPTSDPLDLLADLPNGYFADDLNPFQVRSLASRMAQHGYELFGMGSCSLGFAKTADPSPALIEDLKLVYGQPNSTAWMELLDLLTGSPYLFLGFTDDFGECAQSQ